MIQVKNSITWVRCASGNVLSLFIIGKTTSIEVEGDVSDDEDGGEDGDADVDSRLVEGGVRVLYQIPAWEPAQPDMDICSSYLITT